MRGHYREKTEVVTIRVTPEEKQKLFAKAGLLGLSVSAFILAEALGEEIGQAIHDSLVNKRSPDPTP